MRFGPNLLDEILRRTDLVQLVGRRVKLTRKGRVMWGCCPFHKEKSASFKVENERRAYKCFGCGAGGDAFKWLIETEGLSFPESVEKLGGEAGGGLAKMGPRGGGAGGDAFKWLIETEGLSFPESVEKLAGEAGVELPKWSPEDEAREQKRKSLYEIVELAAKFYEEQ